MYFLLVYSVQNHNPPVISALSLVHT